MNEKKKFINNIQFIKVALLLFMCQIAASLSAPYISVFLVQKIKATNEQVGMYVTISSISAMLFSILIAKIVDKTKQYKKWIGVSILAAVVGYYIYSIASTYMQILMTSITLIGIATCLSALIFAYAKDIFIQNNVPEQAISSLRIFVSLAWVIGPLLGARIFEYRNYEGVFKLCSSGYICSGIILLLLFRKSSDSKITKKSMESHDDVICIKKVYIVSYFIIFVLLQTVNSVLNTNIPLYITEILEYDNVYVGWISSFNAIIEIPVTILFVFLSQKKDVKRLISFGIMNAIVFIILLMTTKNIYFIIFSHIVKAVFVSIFTSLGIAFFQNMIPKKIGLSTVLYTNTTRVGNIISGMLISIFNKNYLQSFWALIGICICCLVAFLFINTKSEMDGYVN